MGRKFLENILKAQFLLNFSGEEQVELLSKAKKKATELDIPLKIVFLFALQHWVKDETSFSKLNDYLMVKKTKQEIVKRKWPKGSYMNVLQDDPDYKEWEKGLAEGSEKEK